MLFIENGSNLQQSLNNLLSNPTMLIFFSLQCLSLKQFLNEKRRLDLLVSYEVSVGIKPDLLGRM